MNHLKIFIIIISICCILLVNSGVYAAEDECEDCTNEEQHKIVNVETIELIESLELKLLHVIKEAKQEIKEASEKLALEKEEWNKLASKFNKTLLPNKIKLDVGGMVFATSKTTLLAHKDSFFEGMFGGRYNTTADEDGSYFIDRDPSLFHIILNFMRGQSLYLENLSKQQLQQLQDDAEFYQLPALSLLLRPPPEFISGSAYYSLSSNNKIATKTYSSSNYYDTIIKANLEFQQSSTQRIFKWKIKIEVTTASYIQIGIAPTSISQSTQNPHTSSGYYLDLSNRSLNSGAPYNYRSQSYVGGKVSPIKTGQTVGVVVNLDTAMIEFTVDGMSMGIAYSNLSLNTPHCPCVILKSQYDSVKIVEFI